ncbi:MAG: sugar transferase [Verrucomicrobiales bacterium]
MVPVPFDYGTKGGSLPGSSISPASPLRGAQTGLNSSEDFAPLSATGHNLDGDPVPGCTPTLISSTCAEGFEEQCGLPVWKRTLDLACLVLGIPFWGLLMVLVAAWIKLTSPGPLIYRQERIGLRGKRFVLFKFRSMKANIGTRSHEGYFEALMHSDRPMVKLDASGDPRVIRWGRLLRASGLDELPQLFNVLRGEMTLVGPRPCTPHEFERYQPSQYERFNAVPGLTGYWQVNGKNKTTFSQMIAMDIYYARNKEVWLDLLIMAKTLPTLAGQVLEIAAAKLERRRAEACENEPAHEMAASEPTHSSQMISPNK